MLSLSHLLGKRSEKGRLIIGHEDICLYYRASFSLVRLVPVLRRIKLRTSIFQKVHLHC